MTEHIPLKCVKKRTNIIIYKLFADMIEGDKVFHLIYGYGTVLKICYSTVKVKMKNSVEYFDISDLVKV